MRNELDELQNWFDEKSDTFQESENGSKYSEYLDYVTNLVEQIESLDYAEIENFN